jgi:FdrA protein
MTEKKPKPLLSAPLKVVNIGLDGFAADLARQNVRVVRVRWSPPAGGKPELARLLAKLGV